VSMALHCLRSTNLWLLAEGRCLCQKRIDRALSVATHGIGEQGKVELEIHANDDYI
jgi:hypothetical protein